MADYFVADLIGTGRVDAFLYENGTLQPGTDQSLLNLNAEIILNLNAPFAVDCVV